MREFRLSRHCVLLFYICFHSMIYFLSIFCNIYLTDSVSQYEIVQQYDVFIDNRSLYLFALC